MSTVKKEEKNSDKLFPCLIRLQRYFKYVEEGPQRKSDRQAQQVMMGISDITEGEGGTRFTVIAQGKSVRWAGWIQRWMWSRH